MDRVEGMLVYFSLNYLFFLVQTHFFVSPNPNNKKHLIPLTFLAKKICITSLELSPCSTSSPLNQKTQNYPIIKNHNYPQIHPLNPSFLSINRASHQSKRGINHSKETLPKSQLNNTHFSPFSSKIKNSQNLIKTQKQTIKHLQITSRNTNPSKDHQKPWPIAQDQARDS
jgi:hypothetical protein